MWRYRRMERMILVDARNSRPRSVTDAYQASAWRSPAAERFDSRPANDVGHRVELETTPDASEDAPEFPRRLIVLAGALIVSMLAVFAANAMAL